MVAADSGSSFLELEDSQFYTFLVVIDNVCTK